MSITIEKINKRLYRLNYKNPNPVEDLSSIRLVDESKNLFFENNALEKIKNWEGLSENTNAAYESALDAYDLMLQYGSNAGIKEATNILLEGASKVRDANSLMRSLRYRFGRIRKVSGLTNVGKATVRNSITQSIKNLQNSLTAGQLMNKSSSPAPEENKMAECYNLLISEVSDINECDRIVRQYSNIHRRFNIDRTITESMQYNDSPYNLIFDIASYVDTFKSSFKSKYNSALESVWYGLNKYHIYCENSEIIKAVTDYFVIERGVSESEIEDIKSIQYITPIFNQSDFSVLDYMDDDIVDTTIDRLDYLSQAEEYGAEDFQSLHSKLKDLEESVLNTITNINTEISEDDQKSANYAIAKYMCEYRKQCLANKDSIMNMASFKALLEKIQQDNCTKYIVQTLPQFLSLIRTVFIIGSDIHDINKATSLIDQMQKMIDSINISKQEAEKVLSDYDNEINTIKAKQTKIDDKEFNSRIDIYLNTLYANRAFIKQYIENFNDPAEDEHPVDEEDDAIKEAAQIILISQLMESLCEDLIDPDIDYIVNGNVAKLSNNTLDALTDFSVTVPSIINKDSLCDTLISERNKIRENASSVNEYIRIDCLNNNIQRLKQESNMYNTCNDATGCIAYLLCLNELKAYNAESDSKYFTEAMSFVNTLRLAANNLRRAAIKLTEKEKAASNSVDMMVNQIAKSMDKEMSAAERERIVRGQILPPASKCLKYALAFGITALVKPELAVIGAIGLFFTRKKSTMRERQMALDEIEIELKMCDRYIRIYEDQQDMEKLRQCEMIQRNLLRQQQRIRYKMKVDFHHADISSVKNVGGEDYRPNK